MIYYSVRNDSHCACTPEDLGKERLKKWACKGFLIKWRSAAECAADGKRRMEKLDRLWLKKRVRRTTSDDDEAERYWYCTIMCCTDIAKNTDSELGV